MLKFFAKSLLWTAAVLFVVAVVTYRPLPEGVVRPDSRFLDDTGGTALGRALAAGRDAHPEGSGIWPLADGRDAFVARALLADAAERSIDAQYYIWRDDISGRLLYRALVRAADRGVRVRLLLDDNNTRGLDPLIGTLNGHANIEVRLFNPFMHRRFRFLGYLSDFPRLNRRMHNKAFVVDNRAAVVGGRNVGNEYFGVGDGVMFADLDVLATGAAVDDVSRDFDRYWNSAASYPAEAIVPAGLPVVDLGGDPRSVPEAAEYLDALGASRMLQRLKDGVLPLDWVRARLVSDDPLKVLGRGSPESSLLGKLVDILGEVESELVLVSPYFVPSVEGMEALISLRRKGVRISVLTNSLAATDVAPVHAGYAKYRRPLLGAGVRLFEMKREGDAPTARDVGLTGSSASSLHAKTFSVDGRRIFVGSFNMDPRSVHLNTEMGLMIESPALAGELQRALEEKGLAHAYAVSLEGGALRWTTREEGREVVHDEEPESGWLQRAAIWVLSWLPIEGLL